MAGAEAPKKFSHSIGRKSLFVLELEENFIDRVLTHKEVIVLLLRLTLRLCIT